MGRPAPMQWMSAHLIRVAATMDRPPLKRDNPRKGMVQDGSATEAVLAWLRVDRRRRVWWSKARIVAGTQRTSKSVDWALIYLRELELVETTSDPRSPRYHLYRAVTQGTARTRQR